MPHDRMTGVLSNGPPSDPSSPSAWSGTISWSTLVAWAAQVVVALILLQTLYFKFTYAPETQVIFATRGARPAATAVGVIELICAVLLLSPRYSAIGALLAQFVRSPFLPPGMRPASKSSLMRNHSASAACPFSSPAALPD